MKDKMIKYLEKLNQSPHQPITRLYFQNGDTLDFVEDYTYFTTEQYMSKELLSALATGKTLSNELSSELELFRIEAVYNK